MSRPPSLVRAATLVVLLVGCSASGSSGDTPDVGTPPGDAASPTDTGGVDAGPDVGPGEDGGAPPPACACPTLPATCTPPASDVVTFSPDDAAFGDQLMSVLACAESTLHMALYSIETACFVEAIEARLEATPGLEVAIVVDDDECPEVDGARACPLRLLEGHPRVMIVDDARSRLMHHKFIVADDERVWVSSGNLSQVSFCTDYNNSLVTEQAEIVAGFEAVFQRMFTDGTFGPVADEEPITGDPYTVYFSPETPIDSPSDWFDEIVASIDGATTRLDAMIFAFTRTEISSALVAAHERGVAVRVLVAPRFAGEDAVLALVAAGVPVREASVHSKVLIVDGARVVTGSANWSMAAWANNENAVFIDDATMAAAFTADMEAAWAAAAE